MNIMQICQYIFILMQFLVWSVNLFNNVAIQ
jgi:hypothetical protein